MIVLTMTMRRRRWLLVLTIAFVSAACASNPSPGDGTTPTSTIVASEAGGSPTGSSSPETGWRARMQTHSELHQVHPNALICITEYAFVLDFRVSSGGALSGSGVAGLRSVPACPHQYNAVIVKKISFGVSGQQTSDGFAITVMPTGSFQPSGAIDLTGMLISLSGDPTNGTFALKVPFTDASHTLANDEFSRKTTAGSGIYTTESSIVIVPAA